MVPFAGGVPATVSTLSVVVVALLTLAGVTASRLRRVADVALRTAGTVTVVMVAVSAVFADLVGVAVTLCLTVGIMVWHDDVEQETRR